MSAPVWIKETGTAKLERKAAGYRTTPQNESEGAIKMLRKSARSAKGPGYKSGAP